MPDTMSYQDFAAKVKSKYPEYNQVDDLTLSQKMVDKYPEYKGIVNFDGSGVLAPEKQNFDIVPIPKQTVGSENGQESQPIPEIKINPIHDLKPIDTKQSDILSDNKHEINSIYGKLPGITKLGLSDTPINTLPTDYDLANTQFNEGENKGKQKSINDTSLDSDYKLPEQSVYGKTPQLETPTLTSDDVNKDDIDKIKSAEEAYRISNGISKQEYENQRNEIQKTNESILNGDTFENPIITKEKTILPSDAYSQIKNLPITEKLKNNSNINVNNPYQIHGNYLEKFAVSEIPTFLSGAYSTIGNTVGFVRDIPSMLAQSVGIDAKTPNPSDFQRDMATLSKHLDEYNENNNKSVTEQFKEGDYFGAIANVGSSITKMMPAIIASSYMGGGAMPYFGALAAEEKYDSLKSNNKIGDQSKAINATLTGTISGVTMYATLGLAPKLLPFVGDAIGKYGAKKATTIVSNAIYSGISTTLRHSGVLFTPVAMAAQGMADKMATNAIDYATGLTKELNLTSGISEAGWNGAAMGIGFAGSHLLSAIPAVRASNESFKEAETTLTNYLVDKGLKDGEISDALNLLKNTRTKKDAENVINTLTGIIVKPDFTQKDFTKTDVELNNTSSLINNYLKTFNAYKNVSSKFDKQTSLESIMLKKYLADNPSYDLKTSEGYNQKAIEQTIPTPEQLKLDQRNSEITAEQQRAAEFIQSRTNPDMDAVVEAEVQGLGKGYVMSGNLKMREDGLLDHDNSTGDFTFMDADGKIHPIAAKQILQESVLSTPVEQAHQEAQATVTVPLLEKHANEDALPHQIGDKVRIDLGNNQFSLGSIEGINPDGTYQFKPNNSQNGEVTTIEPRVIVNESNLNGIKSGDNVTLKDGTSGEYIYDEELHSQGLATVNDKIVPISDIQPIKTTAETPENEGNASVSTDKTIEEPQKEVVEAPKTFKEQIPKRNVLDGKGKPTGKTVTLYEQAPIETTIGALKEQFDDVDSVVKMQIAQFNGEIIKLSKTKLKGTIDEMAEQNAALKQKKAELQGKLNYWTSIEKELYQEKARELNEKTKNVVSVVNKRENKPQEVKLSGIESIKKRWDNATKMDGMQDEIVLANGEKIHGKYVLTEAGSMTPSHNPNGFNQSEGFPTTETGKTVNDRDYQSDKTAQGLVLQRSNEYDQRALQTPVIVSQDGIVLSGNDRTMAGQLAAENGTDKAYNDYLQKHAQKYGFTNEQVHGFDNPRVVFVPDAEMPYTTENFSKFNSEEKKTQNKTEKAVKISKTVKETTVQKIGQIIDDFDSLGDLYADGNATNKILAELVNDGVIGTNEIASLKDGELLSEQGKEFVETLLVGSSLNESALRQLNEMRGIRQTIVKAIIPIINNRKLTDYNLTKELSDAINLIHGVYKQTGTVPTSADIDSYILQPTLGKEFGDNAIDLYDLTSQYFAKLISKGQTEFKKILSLYNDKATDFENGQVDIFDGLQSKDELIQTLLKEAGYEERAITRPKTSEQTPVVDTGEQGTAYINRLPLEAIRGETKGGRRNVEASLILSTDARINKKVYGSLSQKQRIDRQEQLIEEWAKKSGAWIDYKEATKRKLIEKGIEASVFESDRKGFVSKVIYPGASSADLLRFFNDKISLNNYLFPETYYEVKGFTRKKGGALMVIVEQPFIKSSGRTIEDPIIFEQYKKYLKDSGFTFDGDNVMTIWNDNYIVTDLQNHNVIVSPEGKFFFIDTNPRLNNVDGEGIYGDGSLIKIKDEGQGIKNGSTVTYQGKEYTVNGITADGQTVELELNGKTVHKDVAVSELSTGNENKSALRKQFDELKSKRPDVLYLFKTPNGVLAFNEDAVYVADKINKTTTKSTNFDNVVMFDSNMLDDYLTKLVRSGQKVGIIEGTNIQLDNSKNNTNFVENKDNGQTNKTGLDNRQTVGNEPEHLPLGTITTSEPVDRTIEEATNQKAVGGTNAETSNKSWSKPEGLKQLAERAKVNGTWIEDITPLTDGLGHFAKGTENHVYISKEGRTVIKVNNLLFLNENGTDYPHTRDLKYFFDRISIHNELFPKDAYNIIGFTNDKDGNTSVVMQQPFVDSEVHPTQEEIHTDLSKRGFTKTILGEGINKGLEGYTNGKYELTDMKPANVLKMENGTLRYIDLDLSHAVAVAKPQSDHNLTTTGKQPWEMTQDDYIYEMTSGKGIPIKYQTKRMYDKYEKLHEESVQQALSEGKPVPVEVLKDYPDLQIRPAVKEIQFAKGDKVTLLSPVGLEPKEYQIVYINGNQIQVRDNKTFFMKWLTTDDLNEEIELAKDYNKQQEQKQTSILDSLTTGEYSKAKEKEKQLDLQKIQHIQDSISEGELILRTGSLHGRKFSKEELEAVKRQVEKDKAKLAIQEGENGILYDSKEEKQEINNAYGNEENRNEAIRKTILLTEGASGILNRGSENSNVSDNGQGIRPEGDGSVRVERRAVVDSFKESGYVDLVGRKIESHQDIADLWSIHRSPYIEKTHFIFLKDGKIVGSSAITMNNHNYTSLGTPERIKDLYEKYGADGMYMLHNHPSGDPKPSIFDISSTHIIQKRLGNDVNIIGHVIIDHDNYTYFRPDVNADVPDINNFGYHNYKNAPEKLFKERENVKGNKNRLFEISKAILNGDSYKGAIVYMSHDHDINGYDLFPEGATKEDVIRIAQEAVDKGIGSRVVFVHNGEFGGEWEGTPYETDDVIDMSKKQSDMFVNNKFKAPKEDNELKLWQVLGEKGAANLDKAEEATTRLDNLKVAKEMEATKTPQEIRMAAGWEKGGDGLWRYEVPDIEIKHNIFDLESERNSERNRIVSMGHGSISEMRKKSDPVVDKYNYIENEINRLNDGVSLVEYIDDDLIKAYPELSNIKVVTNAFISDGTLGSFDTNKTTGEKTINIAGSYAVKTQEQFKSVLIHEIQHAIQEIEGFAKGGNTDNQRTSRNYLDEYKALVDGQNYNELSIKYENGELSGKEKDDYEKLDKHLKELLEKSITAEEKAYKNYHNLSGEVEARNASTRMNFTEAERREKLLSETADVAPEDQIVLMDGMGVSESRKERSIEDILLNNRENLPETKVAEIKEWVKVKSNNLWEGWADKALPVKQYLNHLRDKGLVIPDNNDYYLRLTTVPSRIEFRFEKFKNEVEKPFIETIKKIQKNGFTYDDITTYAKLKHADEYTQHIADQKEIEVTPDTDFAGKKAIEQRIGQKAEDFIANFESKNGTLVDDFWQQGKKVSHFALDEEVRGQLKSQEWADGIKSMFNYYIPMKGHRDVTAEDLFDYSSEHGDFFFSAVKQAKGRRSESDDPFSVMESTVRSSIGAAEGNLLNLTLKRLAAQVKDGSITINKTWFVKVGENPDGSKIWSVADEIPYLDTDTEQTYHEKIRKFEENMTALQEKGDAYRSGQEKLNLGLWIKPANVREHEVQVIQNGVSYTIRFNTSPRIPQAINETNVRHYEGFVGSVLDGIGNATRHMAGFKTLWRPAFILLTNPLRDIHAGLNLAFIDEGTAFTANVMKNFPHAISSLVRYNIGKLDVVNNKYDKMLMDFLMQGGKTGISKIMELKEVQKSIEKRLKDGINPIGKVFDLYHAVSDITENQMRMAVYMSAIEKGYSPLRATSMAKEATVNFDRKGNGRNGLRELKAGYAFINVGFQAIDNLYTKSTKNKTTAMRAALAIAANVVSGSLIVAGLNSLLCTLFGWDEDKWLEDFSNRSAFTRNSNFSIWTPDKIIDIPLGQEFRMYHGLGMDLLMMAHGKVTATETAVNVMKGFSSMLPYNPIESVAQGGLGSAFPDVVSPLTELYVSNKNWMGTQIVKANQPDYAPGYTKVRTNKQGEAYAPEMIIKGSKFLDNLTGGDGVEKGWLSPNPDAVNQVLGGYLAGIYEQPLTIAEGLLSEKDGSLIKELTPKAIIKSTDDIHQRNTGVNEDYYKIIDGVKENDWKIKALVKQAKKGEVSLTDFPKRIEPYNSYKQQLFGGIVKAIDKMQSKEAGAPTDQQDKIDSMVKQLKEFVVTAEKETQDMTPQEQEKYLKEKEKELSKITE